MARGSKKSYTDKQKRKAEHIEEGYEARGVPKKEAEARAWATVNKHHGGGEKSGSGRGRPVNKKAVKESAKNAARTRAKRATKKTATKKAATKKTAGKKAARKKASS